MLVSGTGAPPVQAEQSSAAHSSAWDEAFYERKRRIRAPARRCASREIFLNHFNSNRNC
jgi:hypothetical protein